MTKIVEADRRERHRQRDVHRLRRCLVLPCDRLDGVQYMLEAVRSFGINVEGRSRLRIAKDRPTQVRKHALPSGKHPLHWFADVVVKSEGEAFAEAHIYPPIERTDDITETTEEERKEARAEAEITRRKKKILAVLARAAAPLTTNGITDRVPGRMPVTRAALARLVDSGEVVAKPGPNRATLHSIPEERRAET